MNQKSTSGTGDKLPIRTALLSVYNKTGIIEFAKSLAELGIKLYATGGTLAILQEAELKVTPIEDLTSYPSILGGRVKTLHPKVFGGILADRNLESHQEDVQKHALPFLDIVCVDLYPFEETVASGATEDEIIEKIDIGGVALLRAAAKNYKHVASISQAIDREFLLKSLETKGKEVYLSYDNSKILASRSFAQVLKYDDAIAHYFDPSLSASPLRYGENAHQKAWFNGDFTKVFEQLHGKELSYNNLLDLQPALEILSDIKRIEKDAACVIIKHNNPCGFALHAQPELALSKAFASDPESAFGGIIHASFPITVSMAERLSDVFFEVLLAPDYEPAALDILFLKKNRIILKRKGEFVSPTTMERTALNGQLIQESDKHVTLLNELKPTHNCEATASQKRDLLIANVLVKHAKSNAITLVKDKQLIGVGQGQTSRVAALKQAIVKAKKFEFETHGASLASDAFFPFDDCVGIALESNIGAIIQPGGSIRDKDSIDLCKNWNLPMYFTGIRHFKH